MYFYLFFQSRNYSGGSQPGSLEALKNMIFKLQHEASLTDSEDEGGRKKLSERVRTAALKVHCSYCKTLIEDLT